MTGRREFLQLPESDALAARLRGVVREEFDVEVYVPDRDDPVLGGGRCAVRGCDGWKRARGVCEYHHGMWRRAGHPDTETFVLAGRPRPPSRRGVPRRGECFDMGGLPEQLRLELAYVLQCRKDARSSGLTPEALRQLVTMFQATGAASLLEHSVAGWRILLANQDTAPARSSTALVAYAHGRVEDLATGADATSEYARDIWDLRRLDAPVRRGPYRLRFDGIAQPWLRSAAKRWARFRLATKAVSTVKNDLRALSHFASFLDYHQPDSHNESAITRDALEAYLPWLAATGLGGSTRMDDLVNLRTFIEHCRRHGWLPRLPPTATIYREDLPARAEPLPRFCSEFVMDQIESETNLARLGNPSLANLVVILVETGLRVGDATALAFHTVIVDSAGWPCLRFLNSKMGGEQLIPLSAKAAAAISDQQDHVRRRWPDGPPLLFPRRNANPDGTKPLTVTSVERSLRRWQDTIGLSDDNGRPIRATPHQFRHTFRTRTINAGVPQHVVQKLLGHASPKMTATCPLTPSRHHREGGIRGLLRRPGEYRR